MKIRQGFVSNSSSSSFIIMAEGETTTIRDVATLMIHTVIEELKNDDWTSPEELQRWVDSREKWITTLNRLDEDQFVQFQSINYDTWIVKAGEHIFVSTCNNTDWDLPNTTSKISDKTEKELKRILKDKFDDFEPGYEMYVEDNFDDFYSLPYEIRGNEMKTSTYCQKQKDERCDGFITLWKTSNGNICPYCDVSKFKRKEKLKEIEKNIQDEKI